MVFHTKMVLASSFRPFFNSLQNNPVRKLQFHSIYLYALYRIMAMAFSKTKKCGNLHKIRVFRCIEKSARRGSKSFVPLKALFYGSFRSAQTNCKQISGKENAALRTLSNNRFFRHSIIVLSAVSFLFVGHTA